MGRALGRIQSRLQLGDHGQGGAPQHRLAREAGLDVDRGVLVDDGWEDIPGVYAAGDVAQAYDLAWGERRVSAIWPTAVIQGQVAGADMAGAGRRYPGSLPMNSLPLFSLRCTALGRVEAAGEGRETLSRLDTAVRYTARWSCGMAG